MISSVYYVLLLFRAIVAWEIDGKKEVDKEANINCIVPAMA